MKHPSLLTRLLLKSSQSPQKSGFTLIEVLVVVLIIAIMASIITPSFLAWANNQRVGSAKSQIADAMRKAQNEAKRSKTNRELRFDNNGGSPRYAITPMEYPGGVPTRIANDKITNWQSLAGEGSAKKGLQIKTSASQLTGSVADVAGTSGVVFNSYGAVLVEGANATKFEGAASAATPVFTVQITMGDNSHKRCIIVKTLLGAMGEEKGKDCPVL